MQWEFAGGPWDVKEDVLTAFAAMLLEHVSFFSLLLARALAAGAGLWVHQGACENTKVHGAGVHRACSYVTARH